MKLSTSELNLIQTTSLIAGWQVEEVERKSDREYDLRISGQKGGFGTWLPLAAIANMTRWTSHKIAKLTDHPEMAMGGDWSGVRDTDETKLWHIFNEYVLSRTKR